MNRSRRTFLKLTGLSLLGSAPSRRGTPWREMRIPKFVKGPEALQGKRWAMVVDMARCREGCRDCLDACHRVHNVPDFRNPKDEIKWIWKEPLKAVFPETGTPLSRGGA